MSNTEKTEISDLRRYMEQSLAEHYTQVITFKDREDSFVSLYAHKDSGQKSAAAPLRQPQRRCVPRSARQAAV